MVHYDLWCIMVSPTLDTGITPDSEKKKNLKNIRNMVLAGIPILILNPQIQQTESTQGLIIDIL